MEKDRVPLTADARNALEQGVAVGRAAARKLPHARILLLADTSHAWESRDDQSVLALGPSLRRVERMRKQGVTEGSDPALTPQPQPPRPDKSPIKGASEQPLVRLACSDPPPGRCHWPWHLLADALVVLGLVDTSSSETGRHALKKLPGARGSLQSGVSHPMLMPTSAGAWQMAFRRIHGPMPRLILWSVAMQPASAF
jgi:hypothetical protein